MTIKSILFVCVLIILSFLQNINADNHLSLNNSKIDNNLKVRARIIHFTKKMSVTGLLSKKILTQIYDENSFQLEKCYKNELYNSPDTKGIVRIRVVIKGDGNPLKVMFISSELKNETLKKCVIENIKKWHFPSSEGSRAFTVVDYILHFSFVH